MREQSDRRLFRCATQLKKCAEFKFESSQSSPCHSCRLLPETPLSHRFSEFSLSESLTNLSLPCMCIRSVWLRPGPERLLHAERRLPLPAGLPEAPRHALQQLQRVRGGGGGDGPGQDLPSSLLCVHHLQVGEKLFKKKNKKR